MSPHCEVKKWTSTPLLARNMAINLIGQAAPMLVAIFAIPLLIQGLGTDRFGVLALVWMVFGYFNLFDLGMGKALTRLVAGKMGAGREQEVSAAVWAFLFLTLAVGVAGTVIVGMLSPWLVHSVLKIPDTLQQETLYAFYLIAVSIPLVVSTAGLSGVLEAHQRFDLLNSVSIPMGVFTFLGPLFVLPFSRSLLTIVSVLMGGRVAAWLIHLLLCFHIMPLLRKGIVLQRGVVGPLIRFGGWLTVSSVVSPLMVYLDRFLIGALVSVAAVAYYTTPFEVVTRLLFLSSAVAGVLFPAFSYSVAQKSSRTALLFDQGIKYVFLLLYPLTLLIVTLAHEGLDLWLGPEFSNNSTHVLQWLAVGVFMNGIARIPFALVWGAGRTDLIALLHLIELPFYVLFSWWLIGAYGIEGAAVSWVMRVTADMVFLSGLAQRYVPGSARIIQRTASILMAALLTFAIAFLPMGIVMKGVFLFLALPASLLFILRRIFDEADRHVLSSVLGRAATAVREAK